MRKRFLVTGFFVLAVILGSVIATASTKPPKVNRIYTFECSTPNCGYTESTACGGSTFELPAICPRCMNAVTSSEVSGFSCYN